MKAGRQKVYEFLAGVCSIGCFVIIWFVATNGTLLGEMIPRPDVVCVAFFQAIAGKIGRYNLLVHIGWSLSRVLIAYCAASAAGIVLGLAMGWSKSVEAVFQPLFGIIRPIPPIAWIPLTILFLGIGLRAKVFIIFFSAFVPCVINAYTGIQLTNRTLINVAKTYGAGSFEIFWRVGIPSSVQMIFAGIRIALGLSWTTLVAAEMLAADAGLGYMILMGRQFARPDIIVLGMVVIGTIGAVFSAVLSALEKRLEHWRAGR